MLFIRTKQNKQAWFSEMHSLRDHRKILGELNANTQFLVWSVVCIKPTMLQTRNLKINTVGASDGVRGCMTIQHLCVEGVKHSGEFRIPLTAQAISWHFSKTVMPNTRAHKLPESSVI